MDDDPFGDLDTIMAGVSLDDNASEEIEAAAEIRTMTTRILLPCWRACSVTQTEGQLCERSLSCVETAF